MKVQAVEIEIQDNTNDLTIRRHVNVTYVPTTEQGAIDGVTVHNALSQALYDCVRDWNTHGKSSQDLFVSCYIHGDVHNNGAPPCYRVFCTRDTSPPIEIMGRKFTRKLYADFLRFVGACNDN